MALTLSEALATPSPRLPLYSWTPGGIVRYGSTQLTVDSQYNTVGNHWVPSYPVNIPPSSNPLDPDNYFTFDGSQLSSTPLSEATAFTQLLAFDLAGTTPLSSTTAPATAPTTPEDYADRIASFSITDLNTALFSPNNTFQIPLQNLEVTTDALGSVATVQIKHSMRSLQGGVDASGEDFAISDRFDMTHHSLLGQSQQDLPETPLPSSTPAPVGEVLPTASLTPSPAPLNLGTLLPGLGAGLAGGLTGLTAADPFQGLLKRLDTDSFALLGDDPAGNNPVNPLETLDEGPSFFERFHELTVEAAPTVATAQADFQVTLEETTQANLVTLSEAAARRQLTRNRLESGSQLDGFIPMAPSLPAPLHIETEAMQGPRPDQDDFALPMALSMGDLSIQLAQPNGNSSLIPFSTETASGGMGQGYTPGQEQGYGSHSGDRQFGQDPSNQQQSRKKMAFTA